MGWKMKRPQNESWTVHGFWILTMCVCKGNITMMKDTMLTSPNLIRGHLNQFILYKYLLLGVSFELNVLSR